MAKQASAENVGPPRQISEHKLQAGLTIIKQDIARAKQQQSKASGDANAAWGRIEKIGLNKKGAQLFASIASMEEALAQDVWRTLSGLAGVHGLNDPDLVDLSEQGGEEGDEEAPAKTPKPKKPKGGAAEESQDNVARPNFAKSLDNAKAHLGTDKPATKESLEDNQDLSDAGDGVGTAAQATEPLGAA